jgi:hypothetical protein
MTAKKNKKEAPSVIFRQLEDHYASFLSYRDEGTLAVKNDQGSSRTIIKFKTALKREKKLRFEWIDFDHPAQAEGLHYLIVSDGQDIWERYPFQKAPESCETLDEVIAGATGISKGLSRFIPALWTAAVASYLSPKLATDGQIQSSELIDGRSCYRISASILTPEDLKIWISEDDYILRRFQQVHRGRDTSWLTVGNFCEVSVNCDIPENFFSL